MNRLRLARRGYEQLWAAISRGLNERTSDQAEAWLREEVCPVVEELMENRSFRLHARWSLDHLSPDANAPERRLVEAVDRALVACAEELAAAAEPEGEPRSAPGRRQSPSVAIKEEDHETLRLVAERPWFDLVCAAEFLHPFRDLHLRDSNIAHAMEFRRRELRIPLGDYVSRSMFARIDYWRAILDRLWREVFPKLPAGAKNESRRGERLFNAKLDLDRAVEELNLRCGSGQTLRRCDACTTLTQAYAAYARGARLDGLKIPPGAAEAEGARIRSCIRRRAEPPAAPGRETPRRVTLCDPSVLHGIAAALEDAGAYYEVPEDAEDLIDWAKDRARLVLVDRSPREVFWEGASVAGDAWDKRAKEWNLLWTLAGNPGRLVDQEMLTDREHHAIRSRRHRLSQMLEDCLELNGFIEAVREQGYKLTLSEDEVILLRDAGGDRLVMENRGSGFHP